MTKSFAFSGQRPRHWPVSFRILYLLYNFLAGLVSLFLLLPGYLLLCLLRRRTSADVRERLGLLAPEARGAVLAVHGVSAGEVQAAGVLIRNFPHQSLPLTLSFRTRDGAVIAQGIADSDDRVRTIRAPWDWSVSVRRWLLACRPKVLVLVENELWPGLICQAALLGIPTVLVSARIYPRDRSRYRLSRLFFQPLLEAVAWIGTQDIEQSQAFLQMGAPSDRVEVMGNLKWEGRTTAPLPSELQSSLSEGFLVVAGSTHFPEERWLLAALADSLKEGRVRLLVAPRKPARSGKILAETTRWGLTGYRLSDWNPGREWSVLVLDRMGVLSSCYRHARLAFVGGSLVPRGGHNPLEAIGPKTAVVIGPHSQNFQEVVKKLREVGGIIQVQSNDELASCLKDLIEQKPRQEAVASRGDALKQAQAPPSRRATQVIRTLIERSVANTEGLESKCARHETGERAL